MLQSVRQVKKVLGMGELKTDTALVLVDFLMSCGLYTLLDERHILEADQDEGVPTDKADDIALAHWSDFL